MHRRTRTILVTAGVLALPLGFMTTAQAQEQADVTIRGTSSAETAPEPSSGDVTEDRSRGNGTWEFLREGIAMRAPSAAQNPDGSYDQAGVYWNLRTSELPSSVGLDWLGTQNPANSGNAIPSVVIRFDVDGVSGNGNDMNFLSMEEIYGGEDVWLSGSSSQAAKDANPSTDGSSSGSQWHGTLEEWAEALPNARVTRIGVNLGGGIAGEGLLRSVTAGDDTYRFTSDEEVAPEPEPTTRNVNGASDVERDGRSVDIRFRAQQRPDNSVEGNRLRWRVAVVGESSTSFVQGFGDVDSWTRTFRRNTGTYTVRVFKNGEKVRELNVRTNG